MADLRDGIRLNRVAVVEFCELEGRRVAVVRLVEKYRPDQARDPHTGQWIPEGGAGRAVVELGVDDGSTGNADLDAGLAQIPKPVRQRLHDRGYRMAAEGSLSEFPDTSSTTDGIYYDHDYGSYLGVTTAYNNLAFVDARDTARANWPIEERTPEAHAARRRWVALHETGHAFDDLMPEDLGLHRGAGAPPPPSAFHITDSREWEDLDIEVPWTGPNDLFADSFAVANGGDPHYASTGSNPVAVEFIKDLMGRLSFAVAGG
jgi:hypothetical protein